MTRNKIKIKQKNIKYIIIVLIIIVMIAAGVYWLIFQKPLLKPQNPVNNPSPSVAIVTVNSWKIHEDPIFHFTLKYPSEASEWNNIFFGQIIQLASKDNRSLPVARFWTRSENYGNKVYPSPDADVNIFIGKTNETLFKNLLKDLSHGSSVAESRNYTDGKEQSLIIDNQPALQFGYSTVIYYPDNVYIEITMGSNMEQKYSLIYKSILDSFHRDLTSVNSSNPYSAFFDDIKSSGALPKQWTGATVIVDIMANDLYQVNLDYNNENDAFISYFEWWTNNRTGHWELLGRYSDGEQGLSSCEDWERLKVAKGMECRRLDQRTSKVTF